MDIATLGISIDSRPVNKATNDLNRMGSQAAKTESQTVRATRNIAGGIEGMGRQANASSRAFTGLATPLRQTSLQLSQVAQQTQASGNFLQALAIQLPDIGLAFGTVGIAAGVVAGTLLPMAANFLSAGSSAQSLDDRLDSLSNVMDELDVITSVLNKSTVALVQTYGDAAPVVREFAAQQAQLKLAQLNDELQQQTNVLRDSAGAYFQVNDAGRTYQNTLARIQSQFGLNSTAAREFEDVLTRAVTSGTLDEQQSALRSIFDLLKRNGVAASDIPPEFARAASEMIELFRQTDAAEQAALNLTQAADGATIGIGNAASEATRMADEIHRAVQNMASLSTQGVSSLRDSELQLQFRNDPVGLAGARANERFGDISGFDPILRDALSEQRDGYIANARAAEENRQAVIRLNKAENDAARAASRSARRAQRSASRDTRSSERLAEQRAANQVMITDLSAEVAALSAVGTQRDQLLEQLRLEREIRRAVKSLGENATQAEIANVTQLITAREELNKSYEQQQTALQPLLQGIDSVSDAIANAIVTGEDLGDAMKGILAQIAKDIIASNIRNLLAQQLTPAGGGGLGFIGSLFSAFSGPRFAAGTSYAPGGFAMVGEQGPEIVHLPAGSKVAPNHDMTRYMPTNYNMACAPANHNIHITHGWDVGANGNIAPVVKQVAQAEASRAAGRVAEAVPVMVDKRNNDRETRRIAPRKQLVA